MAAPTSNNEVTARRLTRLLTGSDGNGGLWGKVKDKISSSINALDVSSVGGAGKYISAISETDGKISATATTMDTTPTASSTNAVTSGGIKTALDGKASSTHVHGNITNAGALQTNDVTIANGDKLVVTDASDSNKVARTSVSFDGSTTGILLSKKGTWENPKEAYLAWGGRNLTGSFGPLDAALISELGANRFACGNAAGITIEYTRDGGTTWVDYGVSDLAKRNLFTNRSSYITVGKADSTNKATTAANYANYKVRVIINCGTFGIYNVFDKFVFYVSTNGSASCYMKMSGVKQAETSDVWTAIGEMQVSGWSGFNIYNQSVSMGASSYATYKKICFLFECRAAGDTNYNGLSITSIWGYGGVGWTTPSTMASTGHAYSINGNQEVTFPSTVTATRFSGPLQGNADTATQANYLTGFTARSGSINWGTLTTSNGYKCVTDLQYKEGNQDTGDIAFGYKAGSGSSVYELSCQIDGYFYQRTGGKRVMDVADINSSFYAPTGAGTSGQLLKSSGSGAPTWATANAALVGITVTSTSVSDGTNTFNKYTHPTTSGNKHIPSGGSSGQFLGWNSDGTAKWVANPNTDTKVKATATSNNAEYKLLATASSSPTSGELTEAVYDTDITLNPSTNTISASLARTFASSSSSTVAETPIITVSGSTDGFKLTYGSETADLGITKLFTTDDANAKLSFGNMVSSTYKEALVITNGSATLNGSATKLASSAGGTSQPVFINSSGQPQVIPLQKAANNENYLTMQCQGAYYAATAGTAAACSGNAATATSAASCTGNSLTATTASKLASSAGGPSQPIYIDSSGTPTAIDMVKKTNNEYYIKMQCQGAYYAATAGSAATAVSANVAGTAEVANAVSMTAMENRAYFFCVFDDNGHAVKDTTQAGRLLYSSSENLINCNIIGTAGYASHIGTSTSHPQIGSNGNPVYVSNGGVVTQCTAVNGFIGVNDVTNKNGNQWDTSTTEIAQDYIFVPPGNNSVSYTINMMRLKVGKTYKILLAGGTNGPVVNFCKNSGSSFTFYSGSTQYTTTRASVAGGRHGGSYATYVLRTDDSHLYHIWGY